MFKLFLTVKTNAKQVKVTKTDDVHWRVAVKAPPQEGRANEAVIEALSFFLDIPKSRISIASGFKSKQKVVHIT